MTQFSNILNSPCMLYKKKHPHRATVKWRFLDRKNTPTFIYYYLSRSTESFFIFYWSNFLGVISNVQISNIYTIKR